MSNWKLWDFEDARNGINSQLANAEDARHPERFAYPNLRGCSDLILASDYSGEHAQTEFQVYGLLATTRDSVFLDWEQARLAVRHKYLPNKRRMSFKALNDALRINAFADFLEAASLLNGVLLCVAVEKKHFLSPEFEYEFKHLWTPDTLQKLLRIGVFGGGLVDGLRGPNQRLHWITDDDAIVSNGNAKVDAINVMGQQLHPFPGEHPKVQLSIAGLFTDDEMRAEDLVAIPDLAAGAFSESLFELGLANVPMTIGPSDDDLYTQVKTTLITGWRHEKHSPLKHLNLVIRRADDGQSVFSFCDPFVRFPSPGKSLPNAPQLNSKWHRALTAALNRKGIDPHEMLRSIGLDQSQTDTGSEGENDVRT